MYKIPQEVLKVLESMEEAGYEVYLVGGCVRDLLLSRTPKDWDIATSAKPEEIQEVFPPSEDGSPVDVFGRFTSFYENDFGTVGIVTDSEDPTLKVIEITPYREETKYSDKRHPDILGFTEKLEDDLKRRDFTINAIAIKVDHGAFIYNVGSKRTEEVGDNLIEIVDLFEGQSDLKNGIIKTVGSAEERFTEDALRLLRAVRLASELGFRLDKKTSEAIKKYANLLKMISKERIRDEFNKIIISKDAERGIRDLYKLDLLHQIVPELEEGEGVEQNKEHIFTVWEHCVRSLGHAAKKDFPLEVRIAALFHDIGKPKTKEGDGPASTFYNHEIVGAKMTAKILTRLRYPKKIAEKIIRLVRWHLFFSDTDVITLSAVRRIVRNVGEENIWDLMKVRFCDRVGMGRPKEEPYRLRKYESMIEEALRSPLSVTSLEIDGKRLMEIAGIESGPKIGHVLHALLEEVLDDPKLNTKEYMEKRAVELAKMPDEELEKIGTAGKERKEKEEEKEIGEIRKKYHVK